MVFRNVFILSGLVLSLTLILASYAWSGVNWAWLITGPLLLLGIYDLIQNKHTLLKIYPVVGHFRYLFESVRRELQQYFVESDIDGAPISREFRSLAYQRAKKDDDTRAFGTIFDVYRNGYEWVNHSMAPKGCIPANLRIRFGGPDCTRPYEASPLNISAMSYGALSRNAVMALNRGAKFGNFAHNTGEGGISEWHLKYEGDLIWQIGTGYFGCRTPEGKFDSALFAEQAARDVIKMIEIKLSQGAKPGHGGLLPAAKLTEEIARIRMVPMGEDVLSPPRHSAFSSPVELLQFVAELRKLSGGKPVGFKLCPGNRKEFLGVCKAMLETGLLPDFITVDGGEGGTGAAPVELTNSVGMPLRDGLHFVNNALRGIGVRDKIRIIASGKSFSAFHMLRMMALGADTVNSARGMMLALGCIQSRSCNTDKCPTGITTQNPARYKQLDVTDKGVRVANFHHSSIEALAELLSILGKERLEDLEPADIQRRVSQNSVLNYAELYPCIDEGCLLHTDCAPDAWASDWRQATTDRWR
ncbi:FMN-binding glutamate synthase family protein [Halomonas sp. SpR1]|uniref:FMN-binding glutamate synthase family protein n=1 Tax=Halomonas sp. SpR1 TaxID=3050462 RepID=UPI0027E47B96|nr:FMN-binding glutamate synthase family protein [Halomonas sp. SpR1]MDQ7732175.1 FMN-binding glutamate synthase family protein [Halomonas sp. SpR1]